MDDVRTKLAANAHASWARWTEYLLSQCIETNDEGVTIPMDSVRRWRRQIATPFEELTQEEKASDFKEADIILSILQEPR